MITFLGITLDTVRMIASLPQDKLLRIRGIIHNLVRSPVCSKRELHSLLGMLNFAMRIIPQGRSFVSKRLALLLLFQDTDLVVQLQADSRADLLMWDKFLCEWNRISLFIRSPMTASPRVFSDAAASVGFSAICRSQWLAGPWPLEVSDILGFSWTSALFEIYPIVAAACTWGPPWQTVIFLWTMLPLVRLSTRGGQGLS